MPLNTRLFRVAVNRQAEPILAREARKLAKLDFETKKEQFMDEFDAHPVTKELEGGPEAFSTIPQLVEAGGNLFSFLGFDKGDDPAGELRKYLDKNIKLELPRKGEVKGNKITYNGVVSFPTVQEVDDAMTSKAPVPWIKRAFTHMISKGIPGLPNYLFRENPPFNSPKPSRSGTAIQSKNDLRGGSFRGIPYIGALLGDLKRRFASPRSRR